jgi:hypothetical protein
MGAQHSTHTRVAQRYGVFKYSTSLSLFSFDNYAPQVSVFD